MLESRATMARRRIPVLVGTIAVLAGCSATGRGQVEVTGTVRDQRTGRAIANALVVAADGTSTRTDGEGRFVLSMREGETRSIRASAALHADAVEQLDVRTLDHAALDFSLAPIDGDTIAALDGRARVEDDHPETVLRWVRETWLDSIDERESWQDDAWRSTEPGAFDDAESTRVAVAHAGDEAADCGACHAAEAALVALDLGIEPAHATLAGGCLACHGARAADGVRMRVADESDLEPDRCTACHDASIVDRARALDGSATAVRASLSAVSRCGRVAVDVARHGEALVLVDLSGAPLGDCDGSGAIDGTEIAVGIEVLAPPLRDAAASAAWLASDRSHGVHNPRLSRAVADHAIAH